MPGELQVLSAHDCPPDPGPAHLPLGLSVEESAGRVDVDHLLVDQCPVALLWVFLGSVPEESTADGLLHSHRGLATGDHIQLVSSRRRDQERIKTRNYSAVKGSIF